MKEPKSNSEWKKWGEIDPLFGVASWENKGKDGSNPWTNEDFYALGESDWNDFSTQWKNYNLVKDKVLEIGCGAGRITKPMANSFDKVEAIDISQDMVEYAKANVTSPNINFHISNGLIIPLETKSVTAVFSCHVFQHFESLEIANENFKEISRVLVSGGSLMIHLPVYRFPSNLSVFRGLYLFQKMAGNIKAMGHRFLTGLGLAKPTMRGLVYPIDYLFDELPKYGFDKVQVNLFPLISNNSMHAFIFATKK